MKASPVERRLDVTGSFIVIIIIRITAAAMAARTIELHVIIIIIIMGPANEGNSAPEREVPSLLTTIFALVYFYVFVP